MRRFNKKNLKDDWKVCLVAVTAGLFIALVAMVLTHLSFMLTWMTITIATIPVWKQIAEWARQKYSESDWELLEAMMCYLFTEDFVEDSDDDVSLDP